MELAEIGQKAERLTKDFVAVRSVNGELEGEKNAADFLEKTLRSIAYFAANPDCVIRQELADDPLKRANIFAYLTGTKSNSPKTIIWHGHMDTVGTEDYGALEPYATSPERLAEEMLKLDLPDTMRQEIASGNWLVGRGACDMKSGGAVFIALMEYLSTRLDTFSGNILLSLNPVEENQHTGMIEGIKVLKRLKKEKGFQYIFAINNDYICPLYEGDKKKYIYTGAVGKLLPCVYIQGYETHVGQCFEGFDASVAAAEIVRAINYNTEFCDGYNGEYSLPPSVLKLKDLKAGYNVQTAKEAFVYFNYFVHSRKTTDILQTLKITVQKALQEVTKRIERESRIYAQLSRQHDTPVLHYPRVMTFAELLVLAEKKAGRKLNEDLRSTAKRLVLDGTDKRDIALELVRKLSSILNEHEPLAIIFFASPYCPYNTLRQEVPEEAALYKKLKVMVENFGREVNEEYEIKQFFPSLSDSSYLKINDDAAAVACLESNMPAMEELYPLPLADIRELNIPALNFGVYGKDAHKWSERLYKPYSFEVLPKLILKTLYEFF